MKKNDSNVNVVEYLENWLDEFIEKLAYIEALNKARGFNVVGAFYDPILMTRSPWLKRLLERIEELDDAPEKLKPCPFCGEPAQLLEDEGSTGHWRTRCNNSMCLIVLCSVVFPTKRQAAEAWNTRGNNE